MIGRTPGNIVAIRPLKDGVIADFDTTERMLRYFIQKVHKRRHFAKPRIVVCVPSRHHRRRAARGQGRRLPGRRAPGLHHRGADGGGDRRRAAGARADRQHGRRHRRRHHRGRGHLASAASSPAQSIRIGGDELDQADHRVREEGVLADARRAHRRGDQDARSARPSRCPDEPQAEIRGRDLVSGLPKTIIVTAEEIRKAIEEPVNAIVDAVKTTLDNCPPELSGDIMDRGIVLTGGGALLQGLDERLRHETGMPVHIAENPLHACGARVRPCVEEFEALQQVLVVRAAPLAAVRGSRGGWCWSCSCSPPSPSRRSTAAPAGRRSTRCAAASTPPSARCSGRSARACARCPGAARTATSGACRPRTTTSAAGSSCSRATGRGGGARPAGAAARPGDVHDGARPGRRLRLVDPVRAHRDARRRQPRRRPGGADRDERPRAGRPHRAGRAADQRGRC